MKLIDRMVIDGELTAGASKQRLPIFNPSYGDTITGIPRGTPEDIDRAVLSAQRAFHSEWGSRTPVERANTLRRIADAIAGHIDEFAEIESMNMGRPLHKTREDVQTVIDVFLYNAGVADKLEGATVPISRNILDFTELVPLGVTAHITPWNFPLGIAARSVAPALAAGNTVVLKPAEATPLTALLLATISLEAGLPPGAFNVVTGLGDETGSSLCRHRDVRGVTFTGSRTTGKTVYATAADSLIPVVLELGGKNAFIVFDDADIEETVEQALEAAFDNTGQVCSAASRFLIHEKIGGEFVELFSARCRKLTIGAAVQDPDLGPLATAEQFRKVGEYINQAESAGIEDIAGWNGLMPDRGYFIPPKIYSISGSEPPLWREEIFGPVVVVRRFSDEVEAISQANDSLYGLTSGVFTSDISRAIRVARAMETGSVWINGWSLGGVQAPTGGTRESGFGKERGMPGLEHYTRIKNYAVRLADRKSASVEEAE